MDGAALRKEMTKVKRKRYAVQLVVSNLSNLVHKQPDGRHLTATYDNIYEYNIRDYMVGFAVVARPGGWLGLGVELVELVGWLVGWLVGGRSGFPCSRDGPALSCSVFIICVSAFILFSSHRLLYNVSPGTFAAFVCYILRLQSSCLKNKTIG